MVKLNIIIFIVFFLVNIAINYPIYLSEMKGVFNRLARDYKAKVYRDCVMIILLTAFYSFAT